MKKLNHNIQINAPKEKVWDVLWNEATYPQWTSVFSADSRAVTDWKEGSKVQFLDGDSGCGMYSQIQKAVPGEVMEIRHLGEIKDGVEQPSGPEKYAWYGAMENYYLQETNGQTELKVELETEESHADYFQETFPKALQKVKELAER